MEYSKNCIDACLACAIECESCATHCIGMNDAAHLNVLPFAVIVPIFVPCVQDLKQEVRHLQKYYANYV
jgi:hypothetical protein